MQECVVEGFVNQREESSDKMQNMLAINVVVEDLTLNLVFWRARGALQEQAKSFKFVRKP